MKENNDVKPVLTDEQLGLKNKEESNKVEIKKENKRKTVTKENSKSVERADSALKNAAATAALKAAIDANTEISEKEAEKTYIKEKMKFMLDKCKNDEIVKFRGDKIYAQYFGKEYSFLYNGVPVTIKFDGSVQEYPKFIYDKIMEKIHEVSESNTPKVQIEDRTGQ
jgi:hypothetical protein